MATQTELSAVDRDLQRQIESLERRIVELKKELNDPNAMVEIIAEDDCLAECRGWEDPYIDDFASDVPIKETIHQLFEALIKHKGYMQSNGYDIFVHGECVNFEYPHTGGTMKHLDEAYFSDLYETSTDYKDHELKINWTITVPKSGYDEVTEILSKCGL